MYKKLCGINNNGKGEGVRGRVKVEECMRKYVELIAVRRERDKR